MPMRTRVSARMSVLKAEEDEGYECICDGFW